ncbi:glycosyltransferase family 2 protein [Patescibacteria group bacterium]|nr:glycosyltransferase family 2 protein [Patescibacteria group bacterium]
MSKDLISIIIPCYQAAKTLDKTLNDIYNQTYEPIEIIAVNDGSTDKTGEILDQHQDRILVIDQDNNGAPAARNAGFERSKGEYILFCDADVRLNPRMIELMHQTLLNNPDKAYCYSNFKFGVHTFDLFPFDPERLEKENYISTMSLIRRENFIGFDENLSKFQDWDLWKRMLRKNYYGVWHPERLFSSPINKGGISGYSLIGLLKIIYRKLKLNK